MMVCAICGKKIFTTYPANWPYRYKSKVFCSQDCKIVHTARDLHKVDFANLGLQDMSGFYPYEIPVREGKTEEEGDEDMRGQKLLTDEQKQKAIEIGLEGGDPIKYLKGLGAANPWGNWGYIKMKLKEKDPEKYRKLMKALGEKPAEVKKADKLPAEAQKKTDRKPIATVTKKEVTKDGVKVEAKLLTREEHKEIHFTPERQGSALENADAEVKALFQAIDGGPKKKSLNYKVIGIETKQGKFQYDSASDQMRWMPRNSTVVIMMQAEDWEKLAEDLPGIMETIGASSREEDDE